MAKFPTRQWCKSCAKVVRTLNNKFARPKKSLASPKRWVTKKTSK